MTVKEAEKKYTIAKQLRYDTLVEKTAKSKKVFVCITLILLLLGIALLLIANSLPKYYDSVLKKECLSSDAEVCLIFGWMTLPAGLIFLVTLLIANRKPLEFQPKDFIAETKELYRDYIRCEDLSDEDKEYYRELLQEIRNAELIASNSSIATSVIMASFLHK